MTKFHEVSPPRLRVYTKLPHPDDVRVTSVTNRQRDSARAHRSAPRCSAPVPPRQACGRWRQGDVRDKQTEKLRESSPLYASCGERTRRSRRCAPSSSRRALRVDPCSEYFPSNEGERGYIKRPAVSIEVSAKVEELYFLTSVMIANHDGQHGKLRDT